MLFEHVWYNRTNIKKYISIQDNCPYTFEYIISDHIQELHDPWQRNLEEMILLHAKPFWLLLLSCSTHPDLIIHFQLDPASKAHAVLGFGSNKASQMLLPIAMLDDFSVLSYANDSLAKFSNKVFLWFTSTVIILLGLLTFPDELVNESKEMVGLLSYNARLEYTL